MIKSDTINRYNQVQRQNYTLIQRERERMIPTRFWFY